MSRPKHLELYSCEGGSARGYQRAGFDVYCVDLFEDYSRKRCPFPTFKGDVLNVLRRFLAGEQIPFTLSERWCACSHAEDAHVDGHGLCAQPYEDRSGVGGCKCRAFTPATPRREVLAAAIDGSVVEWLGLSDFASIGASPPCQHATAGTRAQDRSKYPRLIEPTRELLIQTGLPYVIENVKGADLHEPILLCGTMFGLRAIDDDGTKLEMWRHRLFESNVPFADHGFCLHWFYSEQVAGSYGGARRDKDEARHVRHGGYVPSKRVQQKLLGIDWMTERGMYQSIPPVYTEHLGRQLLAHIESERREDECH